MGCSHHIMYDKTQPTHLVVKLSAALNAMVVHLLALQNYIRRVFTCMLKGSLWPQHTSKTLYVCIFV